MEFGKWANRPRLHIFARIPIYLSSQKPELLIRRFVAFAVIGVILSIVAPVIADETISSPESPVSAPDTGGTPSPSDSPTDIPTDAPIPSDTSQPSPDPTPTSSATGAARSQNSETFTVPSSISPSPTPTPVGLSASQKMRVEIPNILPVDPRANSRNLPSVILSGPKYVLACIRGSNLYFDIHTKNSAQSIFHDEQLVSGDMTSELLITGTTNQVLALLNSYGGLRAVALRDGIGGQYATLSFVAMTEPSLDSTFCGQRSSDNFRIIYFRPLGLVMELIKNGLVLTNR